MAGGRPPKYDVGKHPELVEAWAAGMLTDAAIAAKLGIGYSTFRMWLKDHAEFLAGYEKGRAQLLDQTEMSLYKKANGYDYTEEQLCTEAFVSYQPGSAKEAAYKAAREAAKDGDAVYQVKVTTTRKHVAPDTGALALVLCNRRRPGYDPDHPTAGWQHVQRVEHTGADGAQLSVTALVREAAK